MDIFVSVVVIGYNIEQYVGVCINSLLNQTYDNYEIIFVNDGSTDRTLEIVKNIAINNKILRIVDKSNGGIISARKEGIKAASGEYIIFVDGDDWANDSMIESLVMVEI